MFKHLENTVHWMKTHQNVANKFAVRVQENNYHRKLTCYKEMSSKDLIDFPEVTVEELNIFFTESYQVSEAKSYWGKCLKKITQ